MRNQQSTKRGESAKTQIIPPSTKPQRAGGQQKMRQELTNDESGNAANDEPNIMSQELEDRPFSTGKKIENHLPQDDEITERMVQKGVDDAEQDEVDTASKDGTKNEG